MKTPGISFVIPVYNMERYLPRVIQCLKAQTMPGFEAIFVNDGSRDNSLAICKSAASEDPRFRIIDQPNKGVAKARNAALDAARGEYVCFLDPDAGWSLTWRRCYMRLQKGKRRYRDVWNLQ